MKIISNKKIKIALIVLLTLIFSCVISFKFVNESSIEKLINEEIFQYSYIITFLLTTVGVLITLITFIYAIFDKFFENIFREKNIAFDNNIKEIENSMYRITEELSDNLKLILVLVIIVVIYFIGQYTKLNLIILFTPKFVLVFKIEIYILSIASIIDTVITLLKLLQYGLFSNKIKK